MPSTSEKVSPDYISAMAYTILLHEKTAFDVEGPFSLRLLSSFSRIFKTLHFITLTIIIFLPTLGKKTGHFTEVDNSCGVNNDALRYVAPLSLTYL